MNFSPRPLACVLFVVLAAIALASPQRLQAFGGPPGGPFGNGSYFPNDGTFSAVMRGTNLSGTLQFSTSEGSGPVPSSVRETTTGIGNSAQTSTVSSSGLGGVGSTGVAFIYYNGSTYEGNSQGSINPTNSEMNINFQASAPGQGQQTIVVQEAITTNGTSTTNGTVTNTSQTQFVTTRQINYFDSFYLNGYADCKTSNSFPNQKFKGRGEVVTKQLETVGGNVEPYILQSAPLPVSVYGVRLSNISSSFNSLPVQQPSVNAATVLIPPP
jgi:hypothetical protein